jgi:S-layer homology domain
MINGQRSLTSPMFTDVPNTHEVKTCVETAYNHGINSGYGCDPSCLEFRPGNSATRGQLCKIVYQAVTQP